MYLPKQFLELCVSFNCISRWPFLIVSAVSLLSVALLLSYISSYVESRNAERLGCAPPPTLGTDSFFGQKLLRSVFAKRGRKAYLDSLTRRMNTRGVDTFQFTIFGSKNIVTRDPVNIQALLATRFRDFGMGARKSNFRIALGDGIFTSDGAEWKHRRAALRPRLKTTNLAKVDIKGHVDTLLRAFQHNEGLGWTRTIEMQDLFYRLSMDISSEFLFGYSLNTQRVGISRELAAPLPNHTDAQDEQDFAESFDLVQEYLGMRNKLGKRYYLIDGFSFRRGIYRIHRFADKTIKSAMTRVGRQIDDKDKTHSTLAANADSMPTFLDTLLAEVNDPNLLRSELLHLLIAGRDTVAVTLGWIFYRLARAPIVYSALHKEVMEIFGSSEAIESGSAFLEKITECREVNNVILETLRLHPAIPINSRTAIRDTTLPRGGGSDGELPVYIKRGTEVTYSVYAMHRNPAIWGPDAHEFKPGRWDGRKTVWEYLPFNGGPRACTGRHFAMMQLQYVVVRIIQQYRGLDCENPCRVITNKLTLTCASGNGVRVRFLR